MSARRHHALTRVAVLAAFALGGSLAGCSDDGSATSSSPTSESSTSGPSSTESSTTESESETETETGTTEGESGPTLPETSPCDPADGVLFGSPTMNTGLGSDECQPSCACEGGAWTPPAYDQAFIDAILAFELLDPPQLLADGPYEVDPDAMPDNNWVCAVQFEADNPNAYRLRNYLDAQSAIDDGAWVTHEGLCGQCSSLANLAVYVGSPDLTDPVRSCGLLGITEGEEANIQCLMDLGFDEPCAQIWYFNTVNTREACFDLCIEHLESPNHNPDGSLNPCIQCDEDESGPVFKTYSGRTRRNSGLPSALCRPCGSVYRVTHDYGVL